MPTLDDMIETEPHPYDEFRHSNGVPYAYLEVPVAFLLETIPEGANWSSAAGVQKTLGDYTLGKTFSLDSTKVIIALAAMEALTYRTPAVTYNDLDDWNTWLTGKGYTMADWLTSQQCKERTASADYKEEQEEA